MEKQLLFNREVFVYKNRPKSIQNMLQQVVEKHPNKEVLITTSERLTYAQLLTKSKQLALHFQGHYKLKKGDRVAMLIGNKMEFVLVFIACAMLGVIVVPLNIRSSNDELMFMINHADVQLICAEATYEEVVKRWQEEGEQRFAIFIEEPSVVKDYEILTTVFDQKYDPASLNVPVINEEDPLYIIFTSGTTGLPKGAVGSHVNVIHSVINFKNVLQLPSTTKTLIAVPLFHVTGLIGQLFHMILIGGTSVLMENYQTSAMLELIEEEKITFLFNVPAIYIMMLNHKKFKATDVSSIKTIAYGGAPMSRETIENLMTALPGISLHNAYGATETSSPATIMPKQNYDQINVESVGQPVPVSEMKIVDEEGHELGYGDVGELYIKGPMVIEGYWRNDEENEKNFIDGYWKSGDMAMMDEHKFIYIMDRKKDIINRGGEKVFSVEVENILYEHPDILEVAVVGIPDEVFGEAVKAFVVLKKDAKVDLEVVQSFLDSKIAKYKIPEHIETIDVMPRNAGGKILKHKLLNRE